jgi:uncharacterized protein
MFIAVRELELHPIDFEEDCVPGDFDLGAEVRVRAAIKATGRAQIVEEYHGKHMVLKDIRLNGCFSTSLELACARCLEPVFREVARDFDLLYRPQGTDAMREEASLETAEAEVSYYQGEGILLEDVLREQVLLALPLKVTCREDCKGLCPHCGQNLNNQRCICMSAGGDPRWAALTEIRAKLDH